MTIGALEAQLAGSVISFSRAEFEHARGVSQVRAQAIELFPQCGRPFCRHGDLGLGPLDGPRKTNAGGGRSADRSGDSGLLGEFRELCVAEVQPGRDHCIFEFSISRQDFRGSLEFRGGPLAFFSGDRQGRLKADDVAEDTADADEDAALAHLGANGFCFGGGRLLRVPIAHQLQADHQALAAHIADQRAAILHSPAARQ